LREKSNSKSFANGAKKPLLTRKLKNKSKKPLMSGFFDLFT
jgi:hypothetical protein